MYYDIFLKGTISSNAYFISQSALPRALMNILLYLAAIITTFHKINIDIQCFREIKLWRRQAEKGTKQT